MCINEYLISNLFLLKNLLQCFPILFVNNWFENEYVTSTDQRHVHLEMVSSLLKKSQEYRGLLFLLDVVSLEEIHGLAKSSYYKERASL